MTAETATSLRRTAVLSVPTRGVLAVGAPGADEARADAPVLGPAQTTTSMPAKKKRHFLLKETKSAGTGLVRLNAFWFMVARNEPIDARNTGRHPLRLQPARRGRPRGPSAGPRYHDDPPARPRVGGERAQPRGPRRLEAGRQRLRRLRRTPSPPATPAPTPTPRRPASTLPRVRYYQAWNEGNLEKFYAPQRVGGKSVSADRYRRLLNNAYEEFKAVDPDNQVVVAGTGPRGPSDNNRTAAEEWWRDLLCLKQRNDRPKRNCKPANFDVFDHHPITVEDRPTHRGRNGEVFIVDFHKLSRLLNIAEREDTVGGPRNHEEWATEIYWETDPPETRRGFPELTAARFLEQGIYLLAKQKVDLILNFFMIDAPLTKPGDVANVQGGLLDVKGRRKDTFTAFRFPFVTDPRRKGSKSLAWGIAPRDGKVRIEKLTGRRSFRKWRSVTSVRADKGEIFKKTVKLRGKQKVRARIRSDKSLVWVDR